MSLPTLGLYVHFPWCVRKCPYCDFNSHPEPDGGAPEMAYVDQVLRDLEADARWLHSTGMGERRIKTIFIGGGTPSLMSGAAAQRLMSGIRNTLAVDVDAEVTLEANPGTVDAGHFAAYFDAGINRLSIGVQSFQAAQLTQLGRIHSPQDAVDAVAIARNAGFTAINIDLMHGLPDQTSALALADLEQALALQVPHLSWYQLTIEPKTEFARRPPQLPDENQLGDIESTGLALLEAAGFERYEVSAYGRGGARARHNLNYWTFGDYLGIGAGAQGKLSFADEQAPGGLRIERSFKASQPRLYLATAATQLRLVQEVPAQERSGEFLLNALRLFQPTPWTLYEARTGLSAASLRPQVEKLVERGLLAPEALDTNGAIALTELGRRFLDDVVTSFL